MKTAFMALAFAGVLIAVAMSGRDRTRDEGATAEAERSYLEDVAIVSREGGAPQWSLHTKRVEFTDDTRRAIMSQVRIEFPGRGMSVDASGGEFDVETRDVTLTGGVEARGEGFSITTENVRLDARDGVLTTPGRVLVEGESFRIAGVGLRASREKIEVEGNVEAEFNR
jgi:LPS export ABC transporter protein LptC